MDSLPLDLERRNRKRSAEKSKFFGARLRLARTANGYTQTTLAEAVLAKQVDISRIENDRLVPTESLLRALCEVLNVEATYFERPIAEEYVRHECSFRHLQSTSKKLLEEVLSRGTLYHEVVADLSGLVELPSPNIPVIAVSSDDDIEEAAQAVRGAWGLGNATPIVNMIRVAEHAGVVVTRLPGTSEKVDAFSRYGRPPVIVLASTKASTSRDRFNIAHELGHLVMHRGHITGDMQTERQAHRFAASMLLPRDAFAAEFRALPAVDWPHIYEMKRRWMVAGSAILHRADELGLLSAVVVRRLYKQYMWRGWNKGEPFEPRGEQPELISLALSVAGADYSETLHSISTRLGFGAELTESVTGIAVPMDAPHNVKRIAEYRK